MEGEHLSDLELELFFLLLTVAGNETTRNLMSGGMHAFFENPDQWDRLTADRSLLPTAADEMLRFVSPVMNFRRTAMCDAVLSDTKIAEGDKVVFYHCSGNRDEDVFELARHLRYRPQPQPAHRLRRRRPPLLPGGQPGPHGDPRSCSSTCSTACPTSTRPATFSVCSRSSSTASSTSQ